MDSDLSAMLAGEALKTNPVIVSVAGVLALRETGHVICNSTVATLADTLADFGERHGVDTQTIQYALQAAEHGLCETREDQANTY